MDARLQRRVQRYGWDLAAVGYDSLWQAQLAAAHTALLALASPAAGERVLDIACGTGIVSFAAARAVGPSGHVLGVDLSERMIDAAEHRPTHPGMHDALKNLCVDAKLEDVRHRRVTTTLSFADADEACDAAFVGGPVALAWSRFNEEVRARVRARYLDAIDSWRDGRGYRIPGEFVIAAAVAPTQLHFKGESSWDS